MKAHFKTKFVNISMMPRFPCGASGFPLYSWKLFGRFHACLNPSSFHFPVLSFHGTYGVRSKAYIEMQSLCVYLLQRLLLTSQFKAVFPFEDENDIEKGEGIGLLFPPVAASTLHRFPLPLPCFFQPTAPTPHALSNRTSEWGEGAFGETDANDEVNLYLLRYILLLISSFKVYVRSRYKLTSSLYLSGNCPQISFYS